MADTRRRFLGFFLLAIALLALIGSLVFFYQDRLDPLQLERMVTAEVLRHEALQPAEQSANANVEKFNVLVRIAPGHIMWGHSQHYREGDIATIALYKRRFTRRPLYRLVEPGARNEKRLLPE